MSALPCTHMEYGAQRVDSSHTPDAGALAYIASQLRSQALHIHEGTPERDAYEAVARFLQRLA